MPNRVPPTLRSWSRIAFFLAGVATLVACKAKVQTTAAAEKDGKNRSGEDVLPVASGGGGKTAIAEESRGDLAAYLLTPSEAAALQPVVERYRKPELRDPGGKYTDQYEKYRTFTEDFLTRAMSVKALKPGRKIDVRIADDQMVNAFAGAFQDVTITVGTIGSADGTQLLAVLCHELAHSAQNHSLEHFDFTKKGDVAEQGETWTKARDRYLALTHDQATEAYAHNSAAYQTALAAWKAYGPRIATFSKRQEAEADVIGGQICGHLGMPIATYAEALASFLGNGEQIDAQAGDSAGPETLVEGERFKLDRESLIGYLFPIDSHPSLAERKANLGRAKSVLFEHFDAEQKLFQEWQEKYKGLAGGLGLAGLSLSEAVRANVRTVKTDGGRAIAVKRQHVCGK